MSRNWYNISAERQARIRQEVTSEVREELVAELTPKLEEQIREALWDEARWTARTEVEEARLEAKQAKEQARAEARAEVKAGQPTDRQRRGFIDFVKETELDAHAQAVVASGSADRFASKAVWTRRLFGPIPWIVFLGALPALYAVWRAVGAFQSVEFIGAAVGLLVTFLTLWIASSSRRKRLEWRAKSRYKVASDYLIVAERAKTFRLVHAERLDSKARLDELTKELRQSKEKLDDRFHPRVAEVDVARDSVRHRISLEGIDVEEDFEERLEEATERARA